jgi:DNA-binding protein
MYQPRARSVLRKKMRLMSIEEIQILAHSQYVLQRQREISKFFVNGLIGKNFSRALSFILIVRKNILRPSINLQIRVFNDKIKHEHRYQKKASFVAAALSDWLDRRPAKAGTTNAPRIMKISFSKELTRASAHPTS